MLSAKIEMNERLLRHIRKTRIDKPLTAAELSDKIGRTSSYISSLENRRIAKVSSSDLVKIFIALHDISEEEAVSQIESFINEINESDLMPQDEVIDNVEINKDSEIIDYTAPDKTTSEEELKKLIKIIGGGLTFFSEKRPKDAEQIFKRMINSMHFDMGFAMAVMGMPYSSFKTLSHEERQNAFNDFQEVFKKHFDIAQSKKDEEKTE